MGRLSDRIGVFRPVLIGTLLLAAGYALAGASAALWQFTLVHSLVIAIGCSATFAPLVADVSLWFRRRRGIAVALCASGNYVAGTLWPPVVQHFVGTVGWRATYVGIGLACAALMLPLAFCLRRPRPEQGLEASGVQHSPAAMGVSPAVLQGLLVLAGISCCVAMSTPQVHIVAYCGDLGYGAARGAEMLSLMLGFGVISRVGSGFLADRFGGLATVLLGSVLQAAALVLYVLFDSLASLYVISALFGLFQGGIVPSYAVVVRECFPAREAGARIGMVLMATLIGMALGGWLSGWVDDLTGSYRASFAVGVLWNALNAAIILALLLRRHWRGTRGLTIPAAAG
jgi:MFS family permease